MDALERLLARVRPELRGELLTFYGGFVAEAKIAFGPVSRTGDPEIDRLFDAVVRTRSSGPPER